jgi:ubiquinone/menaquinone biosynthesis C-methylase UbiE
MEGRRSSRGTESFYKIEKVAEEYETIRFGHPAGRFLNSLHQKTILEGVGSMDLSGKKVLDVACGTGRFSRLFRSKGAHVVALDLSRAMLNQSRIRDSAEAYVEAGALTLPFKEAAFDLGVTVNALNHLPAFEEAIGEICRVSRKVVLGLPHLHSLLLLNTLYRILRRWGYRYTRDKTARYPGAPLIYTRYFSERELRTILEKNQFRVTGCPKCRVIPFLRLPGGLIKEAQIVENLTVRLAGRWGTFMAMAAERRP